MATLRKRGASWVLDWRDASGRHRKTLGRIGEFPEREARRILRQLQLELSAGYAILNPKRSPTLGEFAKEYLLWHAAEHPASQQRIEQIVRDHLLPAFGHLELDAIQPMEVDSWKQERLASGVRSATVAKELRTLLAMLNRAQKWRIIERNPAHGVTVPRSLNSKPPRFYTEAELSALYAACRQEVNGGRGTQPDPLHEQYWRLYVNTGMRRAEGLMLRWSWIGRDAMRILSSEEERTKSGRWREIPLTEGARQALEILPRDGEYVLPRVNPVSLSRAFVRDARRAGLDGGLHTLRHTYISHLVMAGVPLRTVQALAGHSSVAVTERYAHLAPGHLLMAGRRIAL